MGLPEKPLITPLNAIVISFVIIFLTTVAAFVIGEFVFDIVGWALIIGGTICLGKVLLTRGTS